MFVGAFMRKGYVLAVLLVLAACSFEADRPAPSGGFGTAGPVVKPDPDVLQFRDRLSLMIENDPELSTTLTVDENGRLVLPMAGPVRVGGLELAAAEQLVKTAYADGYFVDPRVHLTRLENR